MGSDCPSSCAVGTIELFQSTLPRGERRYTAPSCGSERSYFNPRSRVGSDVIVKAKERLKQIFQSTLPRGERQHRNKQETTGKEISIHAPAWGATEHAAKCGESMNISIHAPAWGATSNTHRIDSLEKFQSTLPRGERHDCKFMELSILIISIHAPAWGATDIPRSTRAMSAFQSTLPRGERQAGHGGITASFGFQSTLPRGERRLGARPVQRRGKYFNPRSRVGSDTTLPTLKASTSIFQSTLPRGERHFSSLALNSLISFQSTLPRGERHTGATE